MKIAEQNKPKADTLMNNIVKATVTPNLYKNKNKQLLESKPSVTAEDNVELPTILPIQDLPKINIVSQQAVTPITLPEQPNSVLKNVLIIDSNINDVNTWINSANDKTLAIAVNTTTGRSELYNILKSYMVSIDRIAFVYDNSMLNSKQFINSEQFFSNQDLTQTDNNLLSNNFKFLNKLVTDFGIKNMDFLACKSLLNKQWKEFYEKLAELNSGLIIGASNNNTGNLNHSGDWIMETTEENIKSVYFNSYIENLTGVLNTTWTIGSLHNGASNNINTYTITNDIIQNIINISSPNYVYIYLTDDDTTYYIADNIEFSQYLAITISGKNITLDGLNNTITINNNDNNYYLYDGLIRIASQRDANINNIILNTIMGANNNPACLKSYGGWLLTGSNYNSAINIDNCHVFQNVGTYINVGSSINYMGGIMGGNNNTSCLITIKNSSYTCEYDDLNSKSGFFDSDNHGNGCIIGGRNGKTQELDSFINLDNCKVAINSIKPIIYSYDNYCCGGIMGGVNLSEFTNITTHDNSFYINITNCDFVINIANNYSSSYFANSAVFGGGILGGYNLTNCDSNINTLNINISNCSFIFNTANNINSNYSILSVSSSNIGGIMGGYNASLNSQHLAKSLKINISNSQYYGMNGIIGTNSNSSGGIMGGRNLYNTTDNNIPDNQSVRVNVNIDIIACKVTLDDDGSNNCSVSKYSDYCGGILGGQNQNNGDSSYGINRVINNNAVFNIIACSFILANSSIAFYSSYTGGLVGGYNGSSNQKINNSNTININTHFNIVNNSVRIMDGNVADNSYYTGGIIGSWNLSNNTNTSQSMNIDIINNIVSVEGSTNYNGYINNYTSNTDFYTGGVLGGYNGLINNSSFINLYVNIDNIVLYIPNETDAHMSNKNSTSGYLAGRNFSRGNSNAITNHYNYFTDGKFYIVSRDPSNYIKTALLNNGFQNVLYSVINIYNNTYPPIYDSGSLNHGTNPATSLTIPNYDYITGNDTVLLFTLEQIYDFANNNNILRDYNNTNIFGFVKNASPDYTLIFAPVINDTTYIWFNTKYTITPDPITTNLSEYFLLKTLIYLSNGSRKSSTNGYSLAARNALVTYRTLTSQYLKKPNQLTNIHNILLSDDAMANYYANLINTIKKINNPVNTRTLINMH